MAGQMPSGWDTRQYMLSRGPLQLLQDQLVVARNAVKDAKRQHEGALNTVRQATAKLDAATAHEQHVTTLLALVGGTESEDA